MGLSTTEGRQRANHSGRETGSTELERLLSGLVDAGPGMIRVQAAPAAKADTVTLTAAELLTRLIVGTPTAAANYTLPLGVDLEAALKAAFPDIGVNDSFDFSIVNVATNASFDITVVTNTGWTTLVGGMVVESNEATATRGPSGTFRARRTAAATFTLYRLS